MFVRVALSPSTLTGALTVPVQSVQNGPEMKFLYIVDGHKVDTLPVSVRLIQDGIAVIEGPSITSGMRVVMEGAQNLRAGSVVVEGQQNSGGSDDG
jgi:multidrug efflux pump subunit AcrA (membrane-fusion protein)